MNEVSVNYIRFTLIGCEAHSSKKLGILVAAHELRDAGSLPKPEDDELRKCLRWFNEHLNIPKCLEDQENHRALSWYKPEAEQPIKRMWVLKKILDTNGLFVEVHRSNDPGIIIYEDDWQIVAKPHKGKKVPW